MMTLPKPSTSTTGPCADLSESSFLSVPAAAIWSSSDESVESSVMRFLGYAGSRVRRLAVVKVHQRPRARKPAYPRDLFVVVLQIPPITRLRIHVEDDAGVDRA